MPLLLPLITVFQFPYFKPNIQNTKTDKAVGYFYIFPPIVTHDELSMKNSMCVVCDASLCLII